MHFIIPVWGRKMKTNSDCKWHHLGSKGSWACLIRDQIYFMSSCGCGWGHLEVSAVPHRYQTADLSVSKNGQRALYSRVMNHDYKHLQKRAAWLFLNSWQLHEIPGSHINLSLFKKRTEGCCQWSHIFLVREPVVLSMQLLHNYNSRSSCKKLYPE